MLQVLLNMITGFLPLLPRLLAILLLPSPCLAAETVACAHISWMVVSSAAVALGLHALSRWSDEATVHQPRALHNRRAPRGRCVPGDELHTAPCAKDFTGVTRGQLSAGGAIPWASTPSPKARTSHWERLPP